MDDKYILSQDHLVRSLFSIWGSASASEGIYHNDNLRLFGLKITREDNRGKFQRLAEGVANRDGLGDPSLETTGIFQKLCFQFNNEDIIVELADNIDDVTGSDVLGVNDFARIGI